MKYMLMMNVPGQGPYQIGNWPKADIQAHIGHMIALNKKLRAAGEFVGAEGLTGPDQAKLVRAGTGGVPITDGVFPESKEFLAGYWIVDVESPARAYEIAAEASAAPGPGGAPMNMAIEVREVMSGPSTEFL
ncbi:MAG TPA: YciI family protein [Vicinamibacterales bacterium]|nr:YciI family protein [Vicinamibacterales bacterium]